MNILKKSFVCISLSASLMACSDNNEVKTPLQIPTQYDGANFTINASTQIAVVNQVNALLTECKKSRTAGTKVTASSLNSLFTSSPANLKTIMLPYHTNLLTSTNGVFARIEKSSGNLYTPTSTPQAGALGGVFGAYLFDENGIDLNEAVEKSTFGGILYKHAIDLLSANLTNATTDQLVAIIGANPTFPNSSNATKNPQPDMLLANYAARRDKNDGKGFYSQLKNSFITLQAAIKAGNNYKAEQETAIATIKITLEKACAASAINYCNAVITTMSKTTTTDAEKASALHALSEGIGFIQTWKTIPQQHKKITDAQIDEILTLFNANPESTPTAYKFATEPFTQLPKLQQVISKLQTIYGFTNAELEDFKSNWVSVQGR
jgi:hypothetical protein